MFYGIRRHFDQTSPLEVSGALFIDSIFGGSSGERRGHSKNDGVFQEHEGSLGMEYSINDVADDIKRGGEIEGKIV